MTRTKDVFEFGAADTTITKTIHETGLIGYLVVDIPNFTNAVTTTITIDDTDGYTMYTQGTLAKNTEHNDGSLTVPIDYGYTVNITLSGVPGGSGGDVTVCLYINNTVRG